MPLIQPCSRALVLIADDDARVRRGLRALIEADPCFEVVGEASSVDEVEAHAGLTVAPIVLADLLFPTAADGLALIRRLSSRHRCVIVAISAQSALRQAALDAGALAFLDKGASPDTILETLRFAIT